MAENVKFLKPTFVQKAGFPGWGLGQKDGEKSDIELQSLKPKNRFPTWETVTRMTEGC